MHKIVIPFRILKFIVDFFCSFLQKKNRKEFLTMLSDYVGVVRQKSFQNKEKHIAAKTYYTKNYESPASNGCYPRILLVVHEFSRTGAPQAVLYLAQAIYSVYGVKPVVLSAKNGPLREEFDKNGFVSIVDDMLFNYLQYSEDPCNFVANFDRVIVTSIASFKFIKYFRGICKHMTWWIHETDLGFALATKIGADLPLLFAVCESIWLGSPVCFQSTIKYAPQDKIQSLFYGCVDIDLPKISLSSKKVVFSIFGSIERRKGQDIFLDAIEMIPIEIRKQATFRIVGSPSSSRESISFYKKIIKKSKKIKEVELYENMPLIELYQYYAEADVFVSASRDDPMPIVITHGLMLSKICLCSSAIGHAELLTNKINGIIFPSESSLKLSNEIIFLIKNANSMKIIGDNGRIVFEKQFAMNIFINNVKRLMHENTEFSRNIEGA